MRARAVVLAALLVLVAGCFAEEGAPPTDAGDLNASANASTEAPVDDGSAPMVTAVGQMPHMHDYWAGRERVTLFDDVVEPSGDPFMLVGGAPEARFGGTVWRLPEGAIIMEGSGTLELTATYDDPLVTSVALAYRIGVGGEWSDDLALPNGETVGIDITPEMSDLPHQTTSRWEFVFIPDQAPGVMNGPFQLRVDIVKMRDITLFPGHPMLFEGKPEKVLHDLDHEHTEASYAERAPQIVTAGGFQEKFVTPSEVVPMETKAMRMEVDILETSASPGQVTDIRFFYKGADRTTIGHPTVLPLEGSLAEGRLVYQIPVLPEETDTPYGEESQWLFFVEPATKFTGDENEPDCGGCTTVSIKYHLKVIAYDHELDAYSKMAGEE